MSYISLSKIRRTILRLVHDNPDLNTEEIAELMDVHPMTVKRNYHWLQKHGFGRIIGGGQGRGNVLLFRVADDIDPTKYFLADSRDPELPPPARDGFIYILEQIDHRWYKIGRAKNVRKRMQTIELPFVVTLCHTIPTSDMFWAEKYLHQTFAGKRMNGEWFNLDAVDVTWICSLESLEPEESRHE